MVGKDYLDTRDDYEIEFDSRFNNEESIDAEYSNTTDRVEDDIEISMDEEESVVDRRIKSKNHISYISKEEYNELNNTLKDKKLELKEAKENMNEKKEDGDLSENEAYHYWKDKVYSLEGDIIRLENDIKNSRVTSLVGSNKSISKGSSVHIVVEDVNGVMPKEDINVIIVSSGHSGIMPDGTVKVPDNSEVFKRMEGKTSGKFNLTGTDGNSYMYKFELIGGV